MRKLTFFILLATILVMGFGTVGPASATDIPPLVLKNYLTTAFVRSWNWTIDKTGSAAELLLSTGQTGIVSYAVQVVGTPQDSGWVVNGSIHLRNATDANISLASLVVNVGTGVDIMPTCPTQWDFPPTIYPGYTVFCTYTAALPDGSPRTSTVTAVLTDGTVVSASAPILFGSPASVTGQTIHVTDTLAGDLGTVTGSTDPTVVTFNYDRLIGPYDVCGAYKVSNKASIVETGAYDTWDVNVTVPCAGGCTLTPGYWKTHSQLGPAPYDPAWLNLGPAQEQTTFFLSSDTWYGVFWTAPKGNPYYILAHAYMAAKLNILDGASTTPAVVSAISFAETFFSTYTPEMKLTGEVKEMVLFYATLLDNYNNGLVGPGHCSE